MIRKGFALVLVGLLCMPFFSLPVSAQGNDDCDPAAVQQWFEQRQAWLNATNDVVAMPSLSLEQGMLYLLEILERIESLERPACLDNAMLLTYFSYTSSIHSVLCFSAGDQPCQDRMAEHIAVQRDAMTAEFARYDFNPDLYVDLRPEGWILPAVSAPAPTPTITAAAGTRTNPIPLGEFFAFKKGRVRLVSVVDPFDAQGDWYPVSQNTHVVALNVEYACELADPDQSCKGMDFTANALIQANGTVLDATSALIMGDTKHFIMTEAFGGNTLSGTIYLEVPDNTDYESIRFLVGWEQTYFSPR